MVSGLLGTQDGPATIWCTYSASRETHSPSPTLISLHLPQHILLSTFDALILFQSATLKRLCHFLCRNVASLLYAVGEQTLGVGFVLVCEMQVLVKGLSVSARHRNCTFSVNTKRNASPKTSCAIRIGSHLKAIYIMVCKQASDLANPPSEFIASCYICMYVCVGNHLEI